MHGRSGREFFENAAKVISRLDARDERAALAYVYGFCCHFALDVSCHEYIDEKIAASGVSHTEIEVEFDRSLMIKDGFNPLTHSLTDHIIPTHENADIIRKFYDNLTTDEVIQALGGMIKYNKLLIAPSHLKRYLIYALLGITGNYKEMHGVLVNYKANPQCADSTEKLITVCILAYLGIAVFAIFLKTQLQFWILAILVGMFQGGIQALSRSYFTKIIPEEHSGEYFGLMDICGKGASFVGTTIVSVVSQLTGNISIGVGMIAILFCVGIVIFFKAVSMTKSYEKPADIMYNVNVGKSVL